MPTRTALAVSITLNLALAGSFVYQSKKLRQASDVNELRRQTLGQTVTVTQCNAQIEAARKWVFDRWGASNAFLASQPVAPAPTFDDHFLQEAQRRALQAQEAFYSQATRALQEQQRRQKQAEIRARWGAIR